MSGIAALRHPCPVPLQLYAARLVDPCMLPGWLWLKPLSEPSPPARPSTEPKEAHMTVLTGVRVVTTTPVSQSWITPNVMRQESALMRRASLQGMPGAGATSGV